MIVLGWVCLVLAAIPLAIIAVNLPLYTVPRRQIDPVTSRVSVLIPARDEEKNIEGAVRAALDSSDVDLEVLVLDDGSSDGTGEIVSRLASEDSRVRLITGVELPAGWCGKPHACARLAEHAGGDWLLFHDADVRLAADAASRLVGYADQRGVDLLSGIPRQITATLGEKVVIPVIHFVLLGFLPMIGMRFTGHPAFAAGVGQLMLIRASAYRDCDGHRAIRNRVHDGMALAQRFRHEGKRTDLVDLTPLATCRMYECFRDLWSGFAKNVHEGMGSPRAIGLWTVLLLGGHVVPWVALPFADPAARSLFIQAATLSMLGRLILTLRFRQSLVGALLHPIGVALTVAIQWYGLGRWLRGSPVAWKGRLPA